MAVEEFMSQAQSMLRFVPTFLPIIIAFGFIMSVYFFGRIATGGLKNYPKILEYPIIILSGLFSVLFGSSMFSLLSIDFGMFSMLQPEIFLGALITSMFLALGFWLMTAGIAENKYEKLTNEIRGLKNTLLENKIIKPITDGEARKIAEAATEGKAKKAIISPGFWTVDAEKNGRQINVTIDSLTGEVIRTRFHKSNCLNYFLSKKIRVWGLGIVILVVLFGLFLFRGIPDFSGMYNNMGMTPKFFEELSEMADQEFKPQDVCIGQQRLQGMLDMSPATGVYEDDIMKAIFEEERGSNVTQMSLLDEERNIVIGITEDNSLCYSQEGSFCACYNTAG